MNDAPERVSHVVGIGASAGGIAAVGTFLDNTPADSGLAFVVIMHLDPSRESHLRDLFARHTEMPVVDAEDGMPVLANRVHILPPNAKLRLIDSHFRLEALDQPRAERRPVDYFFTSLAGEYGDHAMCVILSGTGSNGSAGLKRVKIAGGLAVVQDPGTAQYSGMPHNAIATGVVDLVLPADRIPQALVHYLRHPHALRPAREDVEDREAEPDRDFHSILTLLRTRTGQEFRCYRRKTLLRRICRRMGLRQVDGLGRYAALLREDQREVTALARDLLINVTSFFRDPEAWQVLAERAIDPLIAEHRGDESLRIWVPGCATGEEAYSLAMLFSERADAAQKRTEFTIFASDATEDAVAIGRDGVYPASMIEELEPERIKRFFDREDDIFRVRKELRDAVIFAPQNVLQDPPFSRLDLISCRNLLIYLEPDVQRKVISLFHFALRQGGYLFLGNAETAAGQDDLFETLSKTWRIYRRMGPTRHELIDFPIIRHDGRDDHDGHEHGAPRQSGQPMPEPAALGRAADIARRALLDRYAPPSVLVDRRLRVVHFYGATEQFLRQPGGEPTTDLMALLRDGPQARVRSAAQDALAGSHPVTVEAWYRHDGGFCPVQVTAAPLRLPGDLDTALLISFAKPAGAEAPPAAAPPTEGHRATEEQLEQELRAVRDELRMTIEQMESSNEELKASNEEIMSMNEELQSANEELETSKEELQSLNEELNTVNAQLQNKVHELEGRTNDLNNLLNSTDIATLFLDQGMCIRWFTPGIKDLLDLMPSDVGRPISHFAQKFTDGSFEDDAAAVLRTLVPRSGEVASDDGHWYIRRFMPYRTEDNRIDGVVVTFTDITESKQSEQQIARAREFAESIVDTLHQPLVVFDDRLRVLSANETFYRDFQVSRDDTEGKFIYDLGNGQWNIPDLRHVLEDILPKQRIVRNFEVEHDFDSIGRRVMLLNARRLDHMPQILIAIDDITARKQAEERLHRVLETDAVGILFFDESGTLIDANDVFYRMTGYARTEVEARALTWRMMTPPEWVEASEQELARLALTGRIGPYEKEYFRKDGSRLWMLFAGRSLGDGTVVEYCIDVTDRKRMEEALRESEERYRFLFNAIDEGFCTIEMIFDESGRPVDYRFLSVNESFERQTGLKDAVNRTMRSLTPKHEEHWFEIFGRIAMTGEAERFEKPAAELGRYYEVYAFRVGNTEERKVGIIFKDASERKRAEERQALLVRELNHRVKNMLASVQSIAAQTLRRSESLEGFGKAFFGRMEALAHCHDLLVQSNWRGANVSRLLRETLKPHFRDGHDRITDDCADFTLPPSSALVVTLILHELATNAAKYGALSTADGRIEVDCRRVDDSGAPRIHFVWVEHDGPQIAPPTHKGFGRTLIERSVQYELDGEVDLDFRSEGLCCKVTFPAP